MHPAALNERPAGPSVPLQRGLELLGRQGQKAQYGFMKYTLNHMKFEVPT